MVSDLFAGRLLDGEHVIWSGQPRQGLMLTPQDAVLIPFSLAWCGFAVFWEVSVVTQGAPASFTLSGAVFVCFGLFFVFGRFLFDAWLRRGLRYAVTDRRILICRPRPLGRFIAIGLDRIPQAQLTEGTGGRGTIRFGPTATIWPGRNISSLAPALDPTPQFLGISDARGVFDLIQRTITP
jgi:hypothetical protein